MLLQNLNDLIIELIICLKQSFTSIQLMLGFFLSRLYAPNYSNLDRIVCIYFEVFAILTLIFCLS